MPTNKNLFLLPLFICLLGLGFSQPLAPKYQSFHLAPGLTQDDYTPGVVILKVKPEFRSLCAPDRLDVPLLDLVLSHLQVHTIQKTIPNAQPPAESENALGQKMVDLSLIYEVWFDPNIDIEYAVNMVLSSDAVEYAEPLFAYQLFYDPSDTDTASQYYLGPMQFREAWDVSKGDSSIAVGIIDTGTSFTHDELENKVLININDPVDGIDNDNNGFIDDYRGWDFGGATTVPTVPLTDNEPRYIGNDHGVLVAGPVAAETDNALCIAAPGFNTRYVPIKVTVDQGDVIVRGYHGVIYAADLGLPIMNLSWGGTQWSQFGEDAVNYAVINKGSSVFAACGNTPTDVVFYPASYPNAISVGGTQSGDDVWLTDPTFGSSYAYLVDICAPARNIKVPSGNSGCWGGATGTSLASPIACGVAGLVKAHYPGYTNMQVAQRVRVTADDLYSTWPGVYGNKMGRGRVNAYRALTDTTASVRVLNIDFTDPDGDAVFQPGDTIDIYAEFINYLDPVQNLSITLSSPSGSATVLSNANTFQVGDLGMMESSGTCLAPFRVAISPLASANSRIYLKFTYQGDNYQDQEYWEHRISPTYINLDANLIQTSLNSRGNFGFTDFPTSPKGQGFKYDGDINQISEGGFMIGTSATKVSDVVRNQTGNQDANFQSVKAVKHLAPGPIGDEEGHAEFTDAPAGANALGVTVRQHAYQFSQNPDEDYVIFEYVITNDQTTPLVDAYAGLFADWEVGWWVVNRSQYWQADRMVTVFDDNVGTAYSYTAMSLITPDSLHAYAAHEDTWGFTNADKWHALTAHPDSAQSDTADIFQTLSAGPFTIAPGDSHIVAFALFGGETVPQLQNIASAAKTKYYCLIRNATMPTVELGPDILDCNAPATYTLDAGAGYANYQWNTGDSTQTVSVNSTGTFEVRVTDGNGCWDWEKIEVVIDPGVTANMTVSATTVLPGDTIFFDDTTPGATKYYWDFGDGSNGSVQPSTYHIYSQSGTFTVMHIASNGTCHDTLYQTLDVLIGRAEVFSREDLKVWPNPANDLLHFEVTHDFTGEVSFQLHSLTGQRVRSQTGYKNEAVYRETCHLNGLPSGIYIGHLQLGEERQSFKIVIE